MCLAGTFMSVYLGHACSVRITVLREAHRVEADYSESSELVVSPGLDRFQRGMSNQLHNRNPRIMWQVGTLAIAIGIGDNLKTVSVDILPGRRNR
jgi:hypothetical protein